VRELALDDVSVMSFLGAIIGNSPGSHPLQRVVVHRLVAFQCENVT
jgi:hypothetical protein